MADRQPDIPIHADFQQAPGLLEGATTIELAAEDCGLDWWIRAVAQGALVGLDRGKRPGSTVPSFLREPGPLRDNLTVEFAFRSLTEWEATRLCAGATVAAPDVATMEFYATQTLDEARHSQCFRDHLIDLGVPPDKLLETVERVARPDADRLIKPLWDWGQPIYDAGRETGTYFIDTVAIVTILLEGVLAPTTELSELKWKPISPATADIERGACVDEIRHLSVGSSILRRHVQEHPEDKQRLVDLVADGRRLWAELPTPEIVYKREQMFQKGLEQHADVIGDYEITPGVRLVDTTPEDRMRLALEWSLDVQATRLEYMGLEEAMTSDVRV
jgi:hypothetical protein